MLMLQFSEIFGNKKHILGPDKSYFSLKNKELRELCFMQHIGPNIGIKLKRRTSANKELEKLAMLIEIRAIQQLLFQKIVFRKAILIFLDLYKLQRYVKVEYQVYWVFKLRLTLKAHHLGRYTQARLGTLKNSE